MEPDILARLRDASVCLLGIQAFILGLIPLAILYFVNKGMHSLLERMGPALGTARDYFDLACGYVETACAKITAPVIAIRSAAAGIVQGLRALLRALGQERREP